MENIFYGVEGSYRDVTYLCQLKFTKNGEITIPAGEENRSKVFGDPCFGYLKHILIGDQKYSHEEEVTLSVEPIPPKELEKIRKKWWNEKGKYIENPRERLFQLHAYIALDFGSTKDEYPEQLMAIQHVREDDIVLEIGGNIGRNSCVIASILNNDKNLLVLESDEDIARQLRHNRDQNFFHFRIEQSAISKVPLIQKEWNTYVSEIVPLGYKRIPTITYDELLKKYPMKFNVLVADCEGALYQIIKDDENFLNTFEVIIIENDFLDIQKKDFVTNKFLEKGLRLVYNQAGGWGPCYSCFFQVYSKR